MPERLRERSGWWSIGAVAVLFAAAWVALAVAVDYQGPPGERVCSYSSGSASRTSCSDSNRTGATADVFFTGHAEDTVVRSATALWFSRLVLGAFALVLVVALVGSGARVVSRRYRLTRMRARKRARLP